MKVPKYTIIVYGILLMVGVIGIFRWIALLSLFYIIDILLIFLFLFVIEHKNFEEVYVFFKRYEIYFFAVSFLLGFFFVVANIGLGIFTHSFIIYYNYENASLASMLLIPALIMQFIIATVEEITFRGYIMYDLEKYYSTKSSIIVSSILFSGLHIIAYAEGVLPEYNIITTFFFFTNMFLGGTILAILKVKTKTLASSIGFHMAWNFFGYHVFGLSFYPSFYKVIYIRPYSISGFEIGVLTFIVLSIFLIALISPYNTIKSK